MKYKLKELSFKTVHFTNGNSNDYGSVMNISQVISFQTPKLVLDEIVNENGKVFFNVKILPNEACKCFYEKITEFEKTLQLKYPSLSIESIFHGPFCKIKIPFKNDNLQLKVYHNGFLFNYYHIKPSMELMFLVELSKIWISNSNTVHYNLQCKEILVTKNS